MNRPDFPAYKRSALAAATVALLAAGCGLFEESPEKQLAQALQSYQAGDRATATIHVKNALQKQPNLAGGRMLLGQILLEAGDYRGAEKELSRARELGANPADVVPLLGKALIALGENTRVIDEIKLDPALPPEAFAAVASQRGTALLVIGKPDDARRLFEDALTKKPDYPDALVGQARLALSERRTEEAIRLTDRALAVAPKHLEALLLKGDLAVMQGRRDEALADYRLAAEAHPGSATAWLNQASLQIVAGNFDAARKSLEGGRNAGGSAALTNFMMALVEFRQGNYAAAANAARELLRDDPNHVPGKVLAGAAEYNLGNQEQARKILAPVLEKYPSALYVRRLVAASYLKSGQVQNAADTLEFAVQQAPDDAAVLALAGEIQMQKGDFAKAARYFERAVARDPGSTGARTALAVARLSAGDTEQALAGLEAAMPTEGAKPQLDSLLITTYMKRREFDKAIQAAQALQRKQPDNPLGYQLMGEAQAGKGDYASARKSLERALQLNPAFVPAATGLARLDLRDNRPADARRRFEQILEKDPQNLQATMALAGLANRIPGAEQEVMRWLEKAKQGNPGAAAPRVMLARAHAQAREYGKALEEAQAAQKLAPENPDVLETLGSILLETGSSSQAVVVLNKLVSVQPSSAVAHYRLGLAQAADNNRLGAIRSLRRATEIKPDYLEAYVAMAAIEVRAGRTAEALKVAEEVQKRFPKAAEGRLIEGDALAAEKKFPAAVKAYEAAFALLPTVETLTRLHAALAQAGRADEAQARAAEWLAKHPEDTRFRDYLGAYYVGTQRYTAAVEQYRALLQSLPDSPIVLNNLAWAAHLAGDPKALEYAEKANKIRPDNPSLMDTLGAILLDRGDNQRALSLIQRAAEGDPQSPEIRFHLAKAYLKNGNREKALGELEGLLARNRDFPQHAEASALLKELRGK